MTTVRPTRPFTGPNLARRPFVNRRPVTRVSLLLAVAGALLLVLNLFLYVGYARTRSATASELRQIETRIAAEEEAVAEAEAELAEADLEDQNELVTFLNGRITERTFGWSVLFDRLAELLPADVRLVSLSPRVTDPDPEEQPDGQRVVLGIQGEAKDGEDLLELVDALFADPAFRRPDLSSENLTQGNRVGFNLTVVYLPEEAEARLGDGGEAGGPRPVTDEEGAS